MSLDKITPIALLLVSIFVLVKSADLVEDTFVYISKRLRISEFFLGFFLLGIVSSLPELSVAIISAEKAPEVSVGNLLGATLILLTLIVGTSALKFGEVSFNEHFRRREVFGSMILVLLAVVFIADGTLKIWEGIFLLITYIFLIVDVNKQFRIKNPVVKTILGSNQNPHTLAVKAVIGVVVLFLSSNVVVNSAIQVGSNLGISTAFIGLFVLAIGTSLPEIALLARSKNSEQGKLVVGNFIGSAVFNTFILGLLTIFSGGFEIKDYRSLHIVLIILSFAATLFALFSWSGRKITKFEGSILVLVYLCLIITEIVFLTI